MAAITVPGMFLSGTHAARPAASAVGVGTLYSCTTHGLVYQTAGGAWGTWFDPAVAGGGAPTAAEYLVTAANGTLSAERVVDLGAYSLLTRPPAANAEDDHFNAAALDAKWLAYTGYNATCDLTAILGWAKLTAAGAKLQAVPAGDWTIEAEVLAGIVTGAAATQASGLILTNGTTAGSSTDSRFGFGMDGDYEKSRITWDKFVNGSFSAVYGAAGWTGSNVTGPDIVDKLFLRVVKAGTTYTTYVAGPETGGKTFRRLYQTSALGFTPTHFGFFGDVDSYVNYFIRT